MTNLEIVSNYNFLAEIQEREKDFDEKKGKQLFGGRVKLTYAICKNMEEMRGKLKPYEESLKKLNEEYRDIEKEKELMKKYKAILAKDPENQTPMPELAFKKDREEYEAKLKELLEIEVEDVKIHKVSVDTLDGLELSSIDISRFSFMFE